MLGLAACAWNNNAGRVEQRIHDGQWLPSISSMGVSGTGRDPVSNKNVGKYLKNNGQYLKNNT